MSDVQTRTVATKAPVPDVAVVAHSRKSFDGGLPELREVLAREGVTDPSGMR